MNSSPGCRTLEGLIIFVTMVFLAPAAFAKDCADEKTGSCRFVPEASTDCDGCISMLQRGSRSHLVAKLPQTMRSGPNGVQNKHNRTDNALHARDASSRFAPGPSQLAGEIDSSKLSQGAQFKKQWDYEVIMFDQQPKETPTKSKVTLSIIYFFSLGLWGIDRCYMGQYILGTIKCLTAGGLFIWTIVDAIVILVNCLQKADSIHVLGFHANFPKDEVETAFKIAMVALIFHILGPTLVPTLLKFMTGVNYRKE